MNTKVDFYFTNAKKWQKELERLRKIILECKLTEELKWGVPCYTFRNRNVIIIHAFKDYCAVLFVKGALLKDTKGILVRQTENVQSGRQIRFTNIKEINKIKVILKSYINEAVEVEKSGLKVKFKKTFEYKVPKEFQDRLNKMPDLNKAFIALSPGRQRGYLFYFSACKQSKTLVLRIEKCLPKILSGKGLND